MTAGVRGAVPRVDTGFAAVALRAGAPGELDRATPILKEGRVTGIEHDVATVSAVAIANAEGDVSAVA